MAMSDSLEFRLLKYIVAVAETSNFTRAAERLFLAQPSLSKQIRDLEEEIKFPIFDRSRDGVRITPAGEMVLAFAKETLRAREELVVMARSVHLREVPPLRLGFSAFVNSNLLQSFRDRYESMFPGCQMQLAGGDPTHVLQRIDHRSLDCAILPMPIANDIYHVQQISQSPLVVCLPSDDPLAYQTQLDIQDIALRINIFCDPELQPAAHSRLAEMFEEVGIPLRLACSASTPADIQWDGKGRIAVFFGRPGPRLSTPVSEIPLDAASSALTSCKRAISVSSAAMIASVFIGSPYLGEYQVTFYAAGRKLSCLSGVNYSFPSTTTRFPDSRLNLFLSFSRVALLLAGT
jgi:DNA-binding transcriptional LysR family regulator